MCIKNFMIRLSVRVKATTTEETSKFQHKETFNKLLAHAIVEALKTAISHAMETKGNVLMMLNGSSIL